MKKSYLILIALMIVFAGSGCNKKAETMAIDTMSTPNDTSHPQLVAQAQVIINANAATTIKPPSAADVPLEITATTDGQTPPVAFFIGFVAANGVSAAVAKNQMLTIKVGNKSTDFLSSKGNFQYLDAKVPAKGKIQVMPKVKGDYASVTNSPHQDGDSNKDGIHVTEYIDKSGNKAVVIIRDGGRIFPRP
jgi:hypothetical protein